MEAQDRQLNYADKRRRPLEIEIGDKVFIKVTIYIFAKREN